MVAEKGFTLIEVMVFLALLGAVAVMVLTDSARTIHQTEIDQMVRDIDDLSRTAWKMKHAFGAVATVADADRLITNAFVSAPPLRGATANIYVHPLSGNSTVTASDAAVTVLFFGLSLEDCSDVLFRLDAWNWAIVRINGTTVTILKSNTVSPYQGELNTAMPGITAACSNAGNSRTVYLERRLQ